ncbi:TPA: BspA family leucine-rich repeat surface protein [Listeria monocytogenes]|nr:BspA family leucine-rich repeat surface protein [Listeria monocytogenes]
MDLEKAITKLMIVTVLVYIVGMPIQNSGWANELAINELTIIDGTITNEDKAVQDGKRAIKEDTNTTLEMALPEKKTEESNTSNSERMESESVPLSEKETESTELISSETVLEESKGLTDVSEVDSSEITEASSATQQREERPTTKAVTTGTFPNGSTATWQFDDATRTLSVSGGTLINPDTSISKLIGIPIDNIMNIVFEDKLFLSGSCRNLFAFSRAINLDLSNFDTSKVTTMAYMFQESSAKSIDVSNFDTSNVTNMQSMFDSSAVISLDLSSFNTSNVMSMRYMFDESVVPSLDLSSFNTSKVTDMYCMFYKSATTSIDVSNFDTSKVTEMSFMFQGSSVTSLDLSNWDTLRGPEMVNMFNSTSHLQNITLGSRVGFKGNSSRLPDPPTTAKYTGKWQNVGNGTVDKPKGSFIGVAIELMYTYDGSTMADTYVWQPILLEVNVQDSILMVGDTWNPGTVKVPTDKVPSEPTKQGYEFKGWEDTAGMIVDFSTLDLELNSQNEFNFYAAFEKKEYTVTFDVEGKQEQETVPFEDLVTEPMVPYKAGHAFTGWYDSESGGNKWDFSTDTMPSRNMTLYARFNKLGFVTPEIKPVIPIVVTPITPGVDPITPSVEPPTTPGTPSTSEAGGNQIPSNGSGSNYIGNMTITSQGNNTTSSPITSQERKLAKLGEKSSLLFQGFGLLLVLSGVAFFLWKRRKVHS